ncbi:MAG TPA: hypothetical protein VGH30_08930 [Jatrophihabitantaceae bacterium]
MIAGADHLDDHERSERSDQQQGDKETRAHPLDRVELEAAGDAQAALESEGSIDWTFGTGTTLRKNQRRRSSWQPQRGSAHSEPGRR